MEDTLRKSKLIKLHCESMVYLLEAETLAEESSLKLDIE